MRTGLFLSKDDGTISKAIDFESLVSQFQEIDVCKIYDNIFRADDQSDMLKTVKEKKLEAVVLAGFPQGNSNPRLTRTGSSIRFPTWA